MKNFSFASSTSSHHARWHWITRRTRIVLGAFVLSTLLLSLVTFVAVHTPKKALAASPACALSASAPTTILNASSGWPDTKIGVIRNGTSYNFFASTGGTVSGQIAVKGLNGTLDNPNAYGTVSNKIIQNQKHTYNYAAGGKVYQDPNSGMLILLYHSEVWPQAPSLFPFYSRLGLAKSTDGGQNWYDLGEIVTPHMPYSPTMTQSIDVGDGTFMTVMDSGTTYLYIYYSEPGASSSNTYTVSVARAPLADVLGNANQGTVPAFAKYYQGGWGEPGLGGNASIIDSTNGYLGYADVTYNVALSKYLLIGFVGDAAQEVDMLESSDGLNWGNRQTVFTESAPNGNVYQSIVGLGVNPNVTDGQFYLYYHRRDYSGQNTDFLERRTIACASGTIYDAAVGFSSTQGQNQWHYQHTDGTTYTDDATYDGTNSRWSGPDNYDLLAGNFAHPGDIYDAVRTWVAPSSGSVRISANGGTIASADSRSSGVNLKILQNGTQIWPSGGGWQFLPGGGSLSFPVQNVTVAANAHIQFVLDRNGSNNNYDTTFWDPVVTFASSGQTTNVALKKSAFASSSWSSDYDPLKAVDGDINTGWSSSSTDTAPWWEVDLGQAYQIKQIQVVMRQGIDQPGTRNNFVIWASNNRVMSSGYVVLCNQGSTILPYQSTYMCNVGDTTAYRYVAYVKTDNAYSFFAELRVNA